MEMNVVASSSQMTRRGVLAGAGALLAGSFAPRASSSASAREIRITPAPARVPVVGAPHPATDVWAYNGGVPGPEIRVRQGERLRIAVENKLPEPTTIHWHGIRLPNAMDGVPHLTQKPIAPGETFVYEFDCPDAGTFWYHPHLNSATQLGRGLYGALIVEERNPPAIDREVLWVLDDWRLLRDASISPDFGNLHDLTHAGRIGNTVTVNGRVLDAFEVFRGERIRLRLINAANARVFALSFEGHRPQIVALDGQPVEPHSPADGRIVLGPAMRADLILDLAGDPGAGYAVLDDYYARMQYKLLDLAYSPTPLRGRPPESDIRLEPNPLAEPDLSNAERHRVILAGGMMGRMISAIVDGREMDAMSMFRSGVAWAMNGIAVTDHVHEPLFSFRRGRSYVMELVNDTAWPHPMHLHGHVFRVVSRNGDVAPFRPWQDTVLVPAQERAEIAFVADNPGDWMFHCHVLEHQIAGMMGVIRVA
jgi:FtsP/CotA-like multicopper oxidase with cupredoxin domain